jgi:hypothetical protein
MSAGKTVGHTDFTPEEIERSLLALALCGGNSTRAAKMLEADPRMSRVPATPTLRQWRNYNHNARYEELRTRHAPEIEAAAIGDYREIVVEGARAQLLATQRSANNIEQLDPAEAAKVAKDLSVATGIAADKLLLFTDRPTSRTETTTPEQTLAALLQALGIRPNDTIPSTATELPTDDAVTAEAAMRLERATAPDRS